MLHHLTARQTAKGILLAIFVLLLGIPGAASARTFTLLAPIVIDGTEGGNPGVLGTINPVTDPMLNQGTLGLVSGNIDSMGGTGTHTGLLDFFIFDVTLDLGSTSIDEINVSLFSDPLLGNPIGTGAFSGNAGDIDAGMQAPDVVINSPQPGLGGIFRFDLGGATAGNINGGETTVRLFMTYSSGEALALQEFQYATFSISSGTDFTVQGQILPEPGTMLLLGSGLVGIGARQVRRKRGKGKDKG